MRKCVYPTETRANTCVLKIAQDLRAGNQMLDEIHRGRSQCIPSSCSSARLVRCPCPPPPSRMPPRAAFLCEDIASSKLRTERCMPAIRTAPMSESTILPPNQRSCAYAHMRSCDHALMRSYSCIRAANHPGLHRRGTQAGLLCLLSLSPAQTPIHQAHNSQITAFCYSTTCIQVQLEQSFAPFFC